MTSLRIIPIDHPDAPEAAARAIAAGGVIAFPTDTVYGIGAGLWQPEAIGRLYTLKGRPDEKALPVLMANASEWTRVARELPDTAAPLMRAFWPGALTIVLPRRPDVPDAVGLPAPTIGLRVPAHAALCRVLERTGPLATSSANRSGQPPARDAGAVREALGAGVALLLDGGALPPSAPSTVVDLTGAAPVVLRHGAVTAAAIEAALARAATGHSLSA